MRYYCSAALSTALLILAPASARPQQVQQVRMPPGFPGGEVLLISHVNNTETNSNFAVPASCGGFTGVSHLTAGSATRDCRFSGLLRGNRLDYFDVGDFTVTQFGSFVAGGDLKARTSISGTVEAHRSAVAAVEATYSNALTITGPLTPATVVFDVALHGTATTGRSNGAEALSDPELLRGELDVVGLHVDHGIIESGSGFTVVTSSGDGLTHTGTVILPWNTFAYDNTIFFRLSLSTFANAATADVPEDVQLVSDFSNTGRLTGVRVLDAAGDDITSQMQLSFAFTPAGTAPEPTSTILLGTGLVGILALTWRKRRVH